VKARCIDCSSTGKTVLVTQERRVYGRTCTWQICPSCLAEYAKVTEQIRREQEAKALGRTPTKGARKASDADTAQGVLA
jgi:hypothetical protein